MLRSSSILLLFFISFIAAFAGNKKDKNVIDEYGPITICADKLDYSDANKTLIYSGNVFVMQTNGKNIHCNEPEGDDKEKSEKDVYFAKYSQDDFQKAQSDWLDHAKEVCAETKECNFLTGQIITVNFDENKKVESINSAVLDNNLVKVYSYPIEKDNDLSGTASNFRGPMSGEGKTLDYAVKDKEIILKDKANVIQGENNYNGQEIDYDMRSGLVRVPGVVFKDKNIGMTVRKRSKMTLSGVAKDTKLETGMDRVDGKDPKELKKEQEENNKDENSTSSDDTSTKKSNTKKWYG